MAASRSLGSMGIHNRGRHATDLGEKVTLSPLAVVKSHSRKLFQSENTLREYLFANSCRSLRFHSHPLLSFAYPSGNEPHI